MRISLAAALACVALGTACGGSNPGSGSKTLYVNADLTSDGSPEGTWVVVEVKVAHDRGDPVGDASVAITPDGSGELPVPQLWSFNGGGPGFYVLNNFEWKTGFALSVKRGSDWLEGYIQTPGITVITEPIFDTTYSMSSGKPLIVKWRDDYGRRAELTTVDMDKSSFVRQLDNDPLELAIEPNNLVIDNERVTLTRRNNLNLAGGTPGSSLSAITEHRVPFRVVQ